MWVRSQDRMQLQDYDGFSMTTCNDLWFIDAWKGNWRKSIAVYSTSYQCMDILDQIQERINEGCPFVYQMPEDVDVLEKAIKKREEVEEAVRKFKEGFHGQTKS